MRNSEHGFYSKTPPASVPLHEICSIPSAMYKLRYLVKIHDQEAISRTDHLWSELHTIYVVTAGQARLSTANEQFTVDTGSVIVRRAGTNLQHERKRGSLSPLQGFAIAFEPMEPEVDTWPFGSVTSLTSHSMTDFIYDLAQACMYPEADNSFKVHMLFYQLLATLQEQVGHISQENHSWLDLTIKRIHDMYTHPLSREQLAREYNISPEHFSREFKKRTGLTFVEYITRLRIRIVQEHLLLSNPSLQELAELTGYRDTFYLSRKFKQIVGSAPTLYRKKPKKIVSLTFNYTASLIALGQIPHMGAVASWMRGRLQAQGMDQFEQRGEHEFVHNLDLIADADPDLIVGYAPHANLDKLRQIAPTILLPFEELDWQEQLLRLGRIAGLEAKARQWLTHYDTLQQQANLTLDRCLGTARGTAVCIFWNEESGAYIYGQGWGRASYVLYQSLGFSPPTHMKREGHLLTGYAHVPLSEVHLYAADYIFMSYPSELAQREAVDHLLHQACWSNLEAIRNNRVYTISDDMFYGFDPISMIEQLKHIMHQLTSHLSMDQ
ncbi:AraC family transcriptional regulator [Paenibacillus xylanexedens]|uniref:AraC family transcriptional regulator n=1 Tax=Paenibacillus xylanexedens TaxID=528191 RepID=UPI00119ED0B1|nr:AraC family transcriptional regulator [Paenibacillus xylanexedens]